MIRTPPGRRARPPVPVGRRLAVVTCTALVLGGCTRYQPRPVDPAEVAARWQAIDARTATEVVAQATTVDGTAAPTGFDLADGIDLVEAEAVALFFNPSLRATRLAVDIPRAGARHAGRWADPELAVDGAYILENVDDPLVLGGTIGITIPLSGRRGAAERLAAAEASEAELAVVGAEWALLTTLHTQWLALAGLQARVALLEQARSEVGSLIDLAPRFRAAQTVTVVDERLLRIQQLRVEDALRQAQVGLAERRLAVLALLGLHPGHEWSLRPGIDELPPPGSLAADDALAAALEHPQLRRIMAAYQVAERRLAYEIRKQYPDLRIGLGGGVEEGESRLLFGLGLLPIPVWNANREGIARADAGRALAGIDVEVAVQDLIHRFASARRVRRAADERLAFLEDELAPTVDQQVADARRLTGLGQLDLFLLADAMEQARAVRLELLDARLAAAGAALALHALAGPTAPPVAADPSDPASAP